ncbi:hypothetical protein [Allohahella marinimesophila]|uniref:Uncharacterized protein n=1 Tax=Allohahella marinimesophila TaxID=1054972 RepID=A0ABP7P3E1_9GAMM
MGLIQTLLSEGYRAYQDKKSPASTAAAGGPSAQAANAAKAGGGATVVEGLQRSDDSSRSTVPGRYLRVTLQQAGADIAPETFAIQNLLRQKLSEHGIPGNTPIALERHEDGKFALLGPLPDALKTRIADEFNQSSELKQVFVKLSTHTPTFEYLRNNLRLQSAYGSENPVFSSLLSEQSTHNSLPDLTTRLDQLRRLQAKEATSRPVAQPDAKDPGAAVDLASEQALMRQRFAVSINA